MRDISRGTAEKSEFAVINKSRGVLIACEGISGCGKSENVRKITACLNEKGYGVKVLEWNSNLVIRRITGILISKGLLTPHIYSLLQWISFFIDYITKTRRYLNNGGIVIADRYVYTGLTRDKVNCSEKKLKYWICRIIRRPDILIFFDTKPETCYERVKLREKPLFYMNKRILQSRLLKNRELYYLKKLRYQYLKLINEPEVIKNTNVFVVINDFTAMNKWICDYMSLKTGE